MNRVLVQIPVSEDTAKVLESQPEWMRLVSDVVDRTVRPSKEGADPLMLWLRSLPRDPNLPELSMDEIVAEIKAYRAESSS